VEVNLLLPWFPVLLSVGVGARLLGKARGLGLGILGAVYWLLLVHAAYGLQIWDGFAAAASIIAGCAAIIAIGAWSGEAAESEHRVPVTPASKAPGAARTSTPRTTHQARDTHVSVENDLAGRITQILDQHQDWVDDHRYDANPWPHFDELLRSVLYRLCHATHVRPFRLVEGSEELIPLREWDPLTDAPRLSARKGIIGHVLTSGRSYREGDEQHGMLVDRLAEESEEQPVWCFAITHGRRKIGVVTVGALEFETQAQPNLLRAAERLANVLWSQVIELCHSRSATLQDPVSELLTLPAFLRAAERSLHDSYRQGEPVALAVITLEGLRQLNDTGRWELADEFVRGVSNLLKRKVRLDDQLGRFDGSRFILLLRRVDSELASLIIDQLMFRLTAVCEDRARWQVPIHVRCGVVGSGIEQPDLRTLLSEAIQRCHQARQNRAAIASDLLPASPNEGASSAEEAKS
jgi:diguanylate cyclase (GGDEF)-like protein